jgi:Viral coat protein (S domain)
MSCCGTSSARPIIIKNDSGPKRTRRARKCPTVKSVKSKLLKSKEFKKNYMRIPKPLRDAPFSMVRATGANNERYGETWATATEAQRAARKENAFYGNGLYGGQGKYTFGDFTRGVRRGIKMIPAPIKNMLKEKAIEAISGMGLYGGQGAYQSNSLMAGGRMAPITIAANDETDTLTLTDQEFVADIYAPTIASGSSGFNSQTFAVNPGIQAFAPNLSQIACNYTEYTIKQLVYELRPVINESNVNNGLTGIGMMVFNYNPNDDPYDNKEDVLQAHGSVSGKITDAITCGVECSPAKTNKNNFFIRNGPVPYGKDNDEYDCGVMTIATNNIPAAFSNLQIFELHVYYTVELRKRRAGALRLVNQQRDLFVCSGDITYNGGLFTGQFVSGIGGVCLSQQNSIGGQLTPVVGGLLYTLPAAMNGNFEIILAMEGTGFTFTGTPNLTVAGNVVSIADLYAGGNTATDTPASSSVSQSSTNVILIWHVKARSATGGVNNSAQVVMNFNGGTISQWQFTVQELTTMHWTSRSKVTPILLNSIDQSVIVP